MFLRQPIIANDYFTIITIIGPTINRSDASPKSSLQSACQDNKSEILLSTMVAGADDADAGADADERHLSLSTCQKLLQSSLSMTDEEPLQHFHHHPHSSYNMRYIAIPKKEFDMQNPYR